MNQIPVPFQWWWAWAGLGVTLTACCALMPYVYVDKVLEELARQDREDVPPPKPVLVRSRP